ncbi:probable inactive serine/threonine-protein kinase DDB_G0280131 [Sitodiplosis mosellana]|uniref:probable inactive serine/threonine-protein kinase DDB_G0280131 n=1 Tax=Sitodiplosis mosellana TaxID=263140 RepID=UPI002443F83C|nr:probable inactive serine/threonine-protein kinase DDB_G0280131 [Sitodiplosis mosellana]
MSKAMFYCTRFICILLLVNSLQMNCYPIDQNGESDSSASKISFLKESVQLPSGVSDKDLISIRSTLKNFESQMYQLKEEAVDCTVLFCSGINNQLKQTKDNFDKELNNLKLRTNFSERLPTNKNRLFFNRVFQIFKDYALQISFNFNVGPVTTPTPPPTETTKSPPTGATKPPSTTEETKPPSPTEETRPPSPTEATTTPPPPPEATTTDMGSGK